MTKQQRTREDIESSGLRSGNTFIGTDTNRLILEVLLDIRDNTAVVEINGNQEKIREFKTCPIHGLYYGDTCYQCIKSVQVNSDPTEPADTKQTWGDWVRHISHRTIINPNRESSEQMEKDGYWLIAICEGVHFFVKLDIASLLASKVEEVYKNTNPDDYYFDENDEKYVNKMLS